MYDVADGTFLLKTFSYVKTRCPMNFRLYPFDTQTCEFKMSTKKFMSQQVQTISLDREGKVTKLLVLLFSEIYHHN